MKELKQESFYIPPLPKQPRKYIPIYQVTLVREGTVKVYDKCLTAPKQAADLAREYIGSVDRETFIILMLNTKNYIIGINTVSIGSLSASIVHPREIFKPAMLCNSASVILSHNHPSGHPDPSQEDLQVTRRLVDAGNVLGVAIRDHIIIGADSYFSFKEKGLI